MEGHRHGILPVVLRLWSGVVAAVQIIDQSLDDRWLMIVGEVDCGIYGLLEARSVKCLADGSIYHGAEVYLKATSPPFLHHFRVRLKHNLMHLPVATTAVNSEVGRLAVVSAEGEPLEEVGRSCF